MRGTACPPKPRRSVAGRSTSTADSMFSGKLLATPKLRSNEGEDISDNQHVWLSPPLELPLKRAATSSMSVRR